MCWKAGGKWGWRAWDQRAAAGAAARMTSLGQGAIGEGQRVEREGGLVRKLRSWEKHNQWICTSRPCQLAQEHCMTQGTSNTLNEAAHLQGLSSSPAVASAQMPMVASASAARTAASSAPGSSCRDAWGRENGRLQRRQIGGARKGPCKPNVDRMGQQGSHCVAQLGCSPPCRSTAAA